LSALALVGLVHCGSAASRDGFDEGSPPPGGGGAEGGVTSTFGDAGTPSEGEPNGACKEDIDVVLVLDVSSSMGFVLEKLDAEIENVVQASNALKSGAHFGLVLFVDNVKVDDTGDLSNGLVHTKSDTLRAAFAYAKKTYTQPNRNPGDGPSGPTTQNPICEENALDALNDTATQFPWRSPAARVAILVTDDTFLEKPDNYGDGNGDGDTVDEKPYKEGDYPARFALDETIATLKKESVRVFSFTKLKAPGTFDLTKCGTPRRHDSDDCVTYGWSKPYAGKPPIPDQTGGKNFDLDLVRNGSLSLAETINEVVLESRCAAPK
jgi:hypothetical protein